jgi:tetratricopeptide (TPR) repeat protein
MKKNTELAKARRANNNPEMGRRVGLFILLAAFLMLCISAMAQEDDPYYWIKEGYKLKWKGAFEESNKSFERALEIYDKMIEADPGDTNAWENKSSVLISMGRVEEAISVMDSAIEKNPDSPEAWNSKGFTLITIASGAQSGGTGRYNESLRAFDKALELNATINKTGAESWRGKGVVYSDLENYSEALKCFDKATEVDPLYGLAWRSKGILLLKMGRPEESIQALDRALRIDPNDIDSLTMKAQALSALGRNEEAADVFERAMRIDPAEPQAAPAQNKANSSAPLVLSGNSGAAAAIFDSNDADDELDEDELWI